MCSSQQTNRRTLRYLVAGLGSVQLRLLDDLGSEATILLVRDQETACESSLLIDMVRHQMTMKEKCQ
jgi:hypothetical protein